MATPPTPDQRAQALASRQHGAIAHPQVLASGLTDRQIEQRVRSGRWRRAARGVYVVAGSPDSWQQRAWVAALATAGAGGVVSHLSAAALHGLRRPSPLPHVTVPRGRSTRSGVAVVHRGHVPPIDRTTIDGLRCTSASRTVVDAAAILDGHGFVELLDDALCRRLVSADSLRAAAARIGGGRQGLGRIDTELAVWTEDIEPGSVAEVRLFRQLGALGLTGVVSQFAVVDELGEFVARLDAAVPERRCGFEYDGVRRHNPRHWQRDEPRYARLKAVGWDIAPVSKLDLLPGDPYLRDVVARWRAAVAA